ncbi:hypothetical protein JCM9140_1333 [Halalkalibacter wakoensis JCM 9140]|uniref:DNA-binding protein n=1 Tax=Halalkalibacter wakoensis JCM 9140 TaxID=1236970 RepID=W4Q0U2_9BACI|nr:small multi-drug export protein [Halalkalibacter wakoensis]GAE25343.1 hypothetical protein JCM9140_1333 [Halalkalibacter wakoensis JCM 9140]
MSVLELITVYFFVFLLSAIPLFEAYFVIPIAIIGGVSFLPTLLIGLAGNIFTVFLLIAFIDVIKRWREKKKGDQEEAAPSKKKQRAQKLWKRYGLPGLAMIGPLFVGSHLTAFMGLTLGGSKKKTFLWVVISITTWSILFAILAHFGIDILGLDDRPFIQRFFE